IEQPDYPTLILGGTDAALMLPTRMLSSFDAQDDANYYLCFPQPCTEAGAYFAEMLATLEQQLEALNAELSAQKAEPVPPLPPVVHDTRQPLARRLETLVCHFGEHLPEPSLIVWGLLPSPLTDVAGYRALVEPLLATTAVQPWDGAPSVRASGCGAARDRPGAATREERPRARHRRRARQSAGAERSRAGGERSVGPERRARARARPARCGRPSVSTISRGLREVRSGVQLLRGNGKQTHASRVSHERRPCPGAGGAVGASADAVSAVARHFGRNPEFADHAGGNVWRRLVLPGAPALGGGGRLPALCERARRQALR